MKVLLLSHNPICTNNNMGKTLRALFSSFDRDQLCQLYVHPAIPDIDACHSYFRITDKQVVAAGPWGNPGGELPAELVQQEIEKRKTGQQLPPAPWKGVDPLKCLLRDAAWKVSNWYSPALKAWLDKEAPSVIFVAPGYAKFIYDIALRIAKDRSLPVVTYICDDYYFVAPLKAAGGKAYLSALQKKTEELMAATHRLMVISKETEDAYAQRFGVKTEVIMTGARGMGKPVTVKTGAIRNISYFGNLSAGRYLSLAQIGKVVDDINCTHGTDVTLHIYTGDTDPDRLAAFDGIACVRLPGFVSAKAYEEAFGAADMLVHAEAFDEADVDLVKHSVSTKIADSLYSGVPLLAYGPDSISSMKHLIRNECAVTATSEEELQRVLADALQNPDKMVQIVGKALQTAAQFHDKKKNSLRLKAILAEAGGSANE